MKTELIKANIDINTVIKSVIVTLNISTISLHFLCIVHLVNRNFFFPTQNARMAFSDKELSNELSPLFGNTQDIFRIQTAIKTENNGYF